MAKGFKKEPKHYRLRFEDPDLEGLTVTARSLPIGEFLKVTELAALPKDDPQSAKTATEMFRVFATSLVEWNLLDAFDDPVPATFDGILTQELDFVMVIITAWMSAMADVAPKSPTTSNSGRNPLEDSLSMAPPSENPQS